MVESHGTEITRNPTLMRFRIMLNFVPVSINTTHGNDRSPYSVGVAVDTSCIKLNPSYLVSFTTFVSCSIDIVPSVTDRPPLITPSTLIRLASSRVSIPLIPGILSSNNHLSKVRSQFQ